MTSVLHTARINNVDSADLCGDRVRKMLGHPKLNTLTDGFRELGW